MRCLFATGLLLGTIALGAGPLSGIRWDAGTRMVEADLSGEPLAGVLVSLAMQTGWEVWIEPDLEKTVTVRFGRLPLHQALRRILGTWNFALMTGREGRTRLCIFRNSASSAIRHLEVPDLHGRIDNEIIVTLAPGSDVDMEALARELGAEIVGRIEGRNAWLLRFADDESAQLARDGLEGREGIEVADNYRLPGLPARLGSGPGTFSLPVVRANPEVGEDTLVVALLDTRVQEDAPGLSGFLLEPLSVSGEGDPPDSTEPTHGTTMALTMLNGLGEVVGEGESLDVRILPVDVYGDQPLTSTFRVAAGIVAGLESGARLFSISLGGEDSTPFLQRIIEEAHRQGVVFVGAAGNEGGTGNIFPAAYPQFLAVTSSLPDGTLAPYANHGEFVDVVVPGHSRIAYNGSTYLVQGTSVSAAMVAGLAAGLASRTDLPIPEVEERIRSSLPEP